VKKEVSVSADREEKTGVAIMSKGRRRKLTEEGMELIERKKKPRRGKTENL